MNDASFDNSQYEAEVTERWGSAAFRASDNWFRNMSETERAEWLRQSKQLNADWTAAAAAGIDPTGAEGQALAARQAEWLRGIPGTPSEPANLPGYLRGLGEVYVSDERFAANYGGADGARFVRDALARFADSLG